MTQNKSNAVGKYGKGTPSLGGKEAELASWRANTRVVLVEFEPSEMLQDVVRGVQIQAERIFRNATQAPQLEEELLLRYLVTALNERIITVTQTKKDPRLKQWRKNFPLPCLYYNALRLIGEAEDKGFKVVFKPKTCSYEVKNGVVMESEDMKPVLITEEEYLAVTSFFTEMEAKGYPVTGPLSSDVYGDINFMAMSNLRTENGITSYRESSPVFAFYRAFFYARSLSDIMAGIHVIRYNSMTEMRQVLFDLCNRNIEVERLEEVNVRA